MRLLRLQTYRPLEHDLFFNGQFENLEFEVHEALRGSGDIERWGRLAGANTLPGMAGAVAGAARRHVVEHYVFGEYNVCPGMLLLERGGRVDVKILRLSAEAEGLHGAGRPSRPARAQPAASPARPRPLPAGRLGAPKGNPGLAQPSQAPSGASPPI